MAARVSGALIGCGPRITARNSASLASAVFSSLLATGSGRVIMAAVQYTGLPGKARGTGAAAPRVWRAAVMTALMASSRIWIRGRADRCDLRGFERVVR